jgi:plasmid stabilization system protein ParE
MKLVYTEQALTSLEETLKFIALKVSNEKLIEIRNRILDKADTLLLQPESGQKEPFLEHLGLGHRRLVENHCKIIYRVDGE